MTGAPAEVWRKFRFRTVPGWAYAFLALLVTGIGLLPIFIIMAVVSRRASGHLPLTRASRQKLRLVEWGIISLLPLMIVLWLLMLRGIGIELRSHVRDPLWWSAFDFLFSASSFLLAMFFGAAIGNVMRGVPLDRDGYLIVLATLSFLGFVIGLLVVKPLIGPRGNVMEQRPGYHDKLVELRNVHPAFVAEVNYKHQQRAAQQAASYSPPGLPQTPGST